MPSTYFTGSTACKAHLIVKSSPGACHTPSTVWSTPPIKSHLILTNILQRRQPSLIPSTSSYAPSHAPPHTISNDEETAAQRGFKKCKGHTAMEEEAQRFGPRQCESSLWLSVAGHWSSCIDSGKALLVNNMPTLNTHWYLDISLANWKKVLGGAARHCAYSEGVPVNCNVYEAGEQ